MARQGQGFTSGLTPYVNNIAQMLSNHFIQQGEKKRQAESIQRLVDAFQKSQGKVSDIGSGMADLQNLPVQNVNPMNQSTDRKANFITPGELDGLTMPTKDVVPQQPTNIQKNFNRLSSPLQRYNTAQGESSNFLTNALKDPNVDYDRLNTLAKLLQGDVERIRPVAPSVIERDPTKRYVERDQYGNEKVIQEGMPKNTDKEIDNFTGSDGHRYTTYMKPSGETYEKKSEARVRNESSSKEAEKRTEKETLNQKRYNTIMASPYVGTKDLISQGLLTEDELKNLKSEDGKGYKYGGGYVVRDKNGNQKLIFTEKLLENFAKNQAPEAPNQWNRKGYTEIKEQYKDLMKKLTEEKGYTEQEAIDIIKKNEGTR
jgi:hypothetical protein